MKKSYGLSLVEVLVSLSLFSMSSLSLLKHQLHLTKQFQAYQKQALAQQLLDDVSEALLWRFDVPIALNLRVRQELHGTLLNVFEKHSHLISLTFPVTTKTSQLQYSLTRDV